MTITTRSEEQAAQALRVEQALRLLPDVEDLAPLRGFVVSLSSSATRETWAAAEPNQTIGKRALDPGALRARVPQVLNRVTTRAAVLYGAALEALECERSGDVAQGVRALMRAGEFEETGARYGQAHAWYRQALSLAEQLRDRRPEMEALCHLGRLEMTRGYFEEGARAYQRCLALAEAEADQAHAAAACQGLGDVLLAQSQWGGADAWYERGLRYAKEDRALRGRLSLGLGQTASSRGQRIVAAELLRNAQADFETARDTDGVVRSLLARARLEVADGKPSLALSTYREALNRLPESSTNPDLELGVRLRLAELYLDLGRGPDAEDEARRAEEVAIAHQRPISLARVYLIMGKLRGRQGDESGFVFFEQAIELCRSGDPSPRLESDIYREYARFRLTVGGGLGAGAGDQQEARAYLERARELLLMFRDEAARARIDQELEQLDRVAVAQS